MNIHQIFAIWLLVVLGGIGSNAFAQRVDQFPEYDYATAGPVVRPNATPLNANRLYQPQRLNSGYRTNVARRQEQVQSLVPPIPQPIKSASHAIRIKDITTVEGHRTNRIYGLGLVTGLKGTGGKSNVTQEFVRNMLKNSDVLVQGSIPTGSTAVVTVSAELPTFTRPGEKLTATVSLMDDATSLYGGDLQTTLLKGYDGQVYAVAGGALLLGGFSASGDAGGVAKNHDTAAKVFATVEVPVEEGPAFTANSYRLLLKNKDYATAHGIATEINRYFPGHARAKDHGSVDVIFPRTYQNSKMDFVVLVDDMLVQTDAPARIVINQKSGTIVVGQNVRLSNVMFAVGNLIVTTTETPEVSQPLPYSKGETAVVPRTQVTATETGGRYNLLGQHATVGDLAAALNTLGVTPQDLISVFQSMESSGKLQATLVIE